jgi:hypothetical protein
MLNDLHRRTLAELDEVVATLEEDLACTVEDTAVDCLSGCLSLEQAHAQLYCYPRLWRALEAARGLKLQLLEPEPQVGYAPAARAKLCS